MEFRKMVTITWCTRQQKRLMYGTVLWTLWERERVGSFGRVTLKHVEYYVRNELPVQVRCAILDAWGWSTGTTQRDGLGIDLDYCDIEWFALIPSGLYDKDEVLVVIRTRMVWGGRREEGSGWGTHVYLWRIHFDIWQN